jgi:hypothetical protein
VLKPTRSWGAMGIGIMISHQQWDNCWLESDLLGDVAVNDEVGTHEPVGAGEFPTWSGRSDVMSVFDFTWVRTRTASASRIGALDTVETRPSLNTFGVILERPSQGRTQVTSGKQVTPLIYDVLGFS